MSMTPYEWSLRAGSDNSGLDALPGLQGATAAATANGTPANQLGNTAFKVTFASGYDPDYYKNIQVNQGLNWDYFKQAGVFTNPNVPNVPGTAAPSVAPPGGSTAGDNAHKDSSYGLGL